MKQNTCLKSIWGVAAVIASFLSQNASAQSSSLAANATLVANQFLSAKGVGTNCSFKATMQVDGNFVIYRGAVATWFSGTANRPGAKIIMQGDGNLVIYGGAGAAIWSSGTRGKGGTKVTLKGNGQLLMTSSSGGTIWAVGPAAVGCSEAPSNGPTVPVTAPSVPPTIGGSSINTGTTFLSNNSSLTSIGQGTNCTFKAIMQTDGNFVFYRGTQVIWASGSAGAGAKLFFQHDGNLVIYRANGTSSWSSATAGKGGTKLSVHGTGQIKMTNASGNVVWQVGTPAAGCVETAASLAADAIRGMLKNNEYLKIELRRLVELMLGRPMDESQLVNIKPTFVEMVKAIGGSQEYFARCGGTNDLFLRQLMQDVAGRQPSAAELTAGLAGITAGGRGNAVNAYLSNQSAKNKRVNDLYRRFLRREVTTSELSAANSRNNEVETIVLILASNEYKSLAAARDDI
jgi:hypothetical protein